LNAYCEIQIGYLGLNNYFGELAVVFLEIPIQKVLQEREVNL
jgi:hypothetical protein